MLSHMSCDITEARIDSDQWPRFAHLRSSLGNYATLHLTDGMFPMVVGGMVACARLCVPVCMCVCSCI